MSDVAKLEIDGKIFELPIVTGSENERGIDISALRAATGLITLDDGYGNTGSCRSAITYIDGDAGILRYRGYPIEQLAQKSSFVEVAQLLIWGELPTTTERNQFGQMLTDNAALPWDMRRHFDGLDRKSVV